MPFLSQLSATTVPTFTSPTIKVASIGGKQNTSAGIGTVCWKWKDNDGVFQMFKIRDVLYFPEYLVNILSVTTFVDQLDDDQGTEMDTKISHAVLYLEQEQSTSPYCSPLFFKSPRDSS